MSDLVNVAPFQGRLQVDSTTQISLQRYAGAYLPLKISGTWQAKAIPSSGPTLANTGLTQATLYYIYAFDSTGTLTLEASTTSHATDSDTGVQIKSGDATRTLVGMVYMDTGTPGLYRDSTAKRWCVNYWNRRMLDLAGTFSADRTTTSTTFTELNTEIRIQYLTWSDEGVWLGATGDASTNANGQAFGTGLGIDSTTVSSASSVGTASANTRGTIGLGIWVTLAEGFHYTTILGSVSGNTGTWCSADNVSVGDGKVRLWGALRG